MIGTVLGGLQFRLFSQEVGRGEFKVTLDHLFSAFIGSMSQITVW
jgi:hypothetical protein